MNTINLWERLKHNNDTGLYNDLDWDKYIDFSAIFDESTMIPEPTPAQLNFLGYMYAVGKGVVSDPVVAISFYEKAASAGNVYAKFNLGRAYELGRGVKTDIERAIDFYHDAAAGGLSMAKNALAMLENIDYIQSLRGKIKNLEKTIKDLQEENNHLRYKPGEIGYLEAKKEFEELAGQVCAQPKTASKK